MALLEKILPKFKKQVTEKTTSNVHETAIGQIDAIIDLINWFAYFVGMEVKSDWKFNLRSKGNMIMNLWYFWTEIYSFYLLIPSVDCVILVAGTVFTSTVIVKFAVFVLNHERILSMVNFIYDIANKNTEGNKHLILLDALKTIYRHFKHIIIGIYFGGVVYMFYPIYDLVVNGNLTPISPLIFPFADDGTVRSFWISTACNLISPMWNSMGTVAICCTFIAFVEMYGTLIALIEDDIHTFDRMWKMGNQNIADRRAAFRNIIMEIMDTARFNLLMNDLFSLTATVQLGCCFFTLSTLLFAYLALGFVGGFGACVYFFTELMMICYIGQLMDNQTARIGLIIFHSDWYVYDVTYQKDLMFALCMVQNLKSIAVAGIWPLNFEVSVKVIKNIYSIIMFLLNVLE